MTDSPANRRRQANQLRTQLLAILADAPGPTTTAELREHLSSQPGQPVVIERVYRALVILADRGELHRVPTRGRNTQWACHAVDRPALAPGPHGQLPQRPAS